MSISMGFFNSSDAQYEANKTRRNSSIVMYPCSPLERTGSCDRQTNLQPTYCLQPVSTRLSACGKLLVDFPNDDENMDCDENERFDHFHTHQKTYGVSKGYEGERFSISKHSIHNTSAKCVQMDSYLYDSDDDEEILLNERVMKVKGYSVSTSVQPNNGGELERMRALSQNFNTADFPGGRNARPLVGGFAAAAYEAAREHHYSGRKDEDDRQRKTERPPFPSI